MTALHGSSFLNVHAPKLDFTGLVIPSCSSHMQEHKPCPLPVSDLSQSLPLIGPLSEIPKKALRRSRGREPRHAATHHDFCEVSKHLLLLPFFLGIS